MKYLLLFFCFLTLPCHADDLRIVAQTIIEDATSSTTGATFVPFPPDHAADVRVTNISGTTIEVRYLNAGKAYPIASPGFVLFRGITDSSQLSFRRTDLGNTPVKANLMIEQ